jgi:hypothetical protein
MKYRTYVYCSALGMRHKRPHTTIAVIIIQNSFRGVTYWFKDDIAKSDIFLTPGGLSLEMVFGCAWVYFFGLIIFISCIKNNYFI